MKTRLVLVLGWFLACVGLFVLPLARAIPRYSARYEQNCNLCHMNPTGGGLRSLYATKFIAPEELALTTLRDDDIAGMTPDITENITIGADFRTFHFWSDDEVQNKNFFQMQGDLYINFQMGKRLSLYYDQGISQKFELFGLAYVLPFNGYVKVGRFVPAYGWRFADHTMFVREYVDFFPPRHSDVGVEVGFYPKRLALNLGLVNGAGGSTQDENKKVAGIGSASVRFNLAGVGMLVGVSGFTNPKSREIRDAAGGFGYLTWKRLTWLGEIDWLRVNPASTDDVTSFFASNELTFQIKQGLDLKATYDFFDPDWNLKTGSLNRYGGGVYVFLNPFVALEGLVRAYSSETGPDMTIEDYVETVLQLHLMY